MKAGKTLIRRWIKFTLTVFILFILNILFAATAFSEDCYSVTDIAGNAVKTDEKGRYLATSDIIFRFFDIREPEAVRNGDSSWIFCEAEHCDGREIYTPVHESYRLDIKEDKELYFVWLDRISGETVKDKSLPESFTVLYRGKEEFLPSAEFSYEKINGEEEIILSGSAPVLKITSPPEIRSYLYVEKNGEEQRTEIEGEIQEFVFDEGEYNLSLRAVDGWGIETEVPLDTEHFIYDKSCPVIKNVSVKASGEKSLKEGDSFMSVGSVLISPEAEDNLAGIDHYIFHVVNSIKRSEYEAYGDSLRLSPCFNGIVSVRSIDRAGNISGEVVTPVILIDNRAPVLKNRVFKAEKKGKTGLMLSFDAEDGLSGLRKLSLFLNGKNIGEAEFNGDRKGSMESSVKAEKLKEGENSLRLEAEDILKNKASYDFNIELEDERNRDTDRDMEYDEIPEMYLRGFENFQKTEGNVRIEAGVGNSFPDEGRVFIERHDKNGELSDVYESEPGEIEITDEGNYVVHYEIEDRGNIYEEYGYFTIDRSSPVVGSLKDIDRKTFSSFSVDSDPLNSIEDYTYVNGRMTLSGREYDGHEIRENGKYILKISATDELGHSTEESAEFLIDNNGSKKKTLSGNMQEKSSVSRDFLPEDSISDNKGGHTLKKKKRKGEELNSRDIYFIKEKTSENSISENRAGPSKSGREKTIYRREAAVIPLILSAALFLLVVGMLILVINPVMERNGIE